MGLTSSIQPYGQPFRCFSVNKIINHYAHHLILIQKKLTNLAKDYFGKLKRESG